MAKKKKDWLSQHNNNVEAYARQVNDLYMELLREVVRIQKTVDYDNKTPFSFSSYPTVKDRVTKLFASFSRNMVGVITDGSKREWALSNAKNNELLNQLFASSKVPEELIDKLKPQNAGALKSFLARKDKGLTLSDKIWKYTVQGRDQIENALTVGIGKGTSSTYLAQKMMQYLKEPSRMDVDARQLHKLEYREELLRRIDSNKPGVGNYKSAYANSMRLARTETNMAYHSADHQTYNNWDFVVGIEVRRSNNPFVCSVCESLKGRYPKTFKFRSWHPQCRCHTVPILMTDEEFNAVEVMMLNEEDTSGFVSENAVTSMPAGWINWIDANRDRLLTSKSVPYFIRDNFKNGNIKNGLNLIGLTPTLTLNVAPVQLDLNKLIKGDIPTNKEVESIMLEYADMFPDDFRRGIESLKFRKSGSYLMKHSMSYNQRTKHWVGGSDFAISTTSFRIKGQIFNPGEELKAALGAIKNGKALSFSQEYSIESLWHEILHAKSKTIPRKLTSLQLQSMETLNQFTARHTYDSFLSRLGGSANHKADILDRGYGYSKWVKDFRDKLKHFNIAEQFALEELHPILMGDYHKIDVELMKFFTKHGKP